MKTSCIINNYNYGSFVVDAVKTAIDQSVKFDEIIIVDDCSTDQSVQLIKENFSDNPQIKLILKQKNEGQLSAFNEGYLAATGDIIFFLDSDDLYQDTYLEEALNFYKNNQNCDFLFCAYENFAESSGESSRPKHDSIGVFKQYDRDRDLGYSVVLTLYSPKWIGAITSTISMTRKTAGKFLPLPFLEDWRGRADDCLLWGAALVGARRFYMAKPLVRRRLHGNNYVIKEIKNKENISYFYQRSLNINRLFEHIRTKLNYSSDLAGFAPIEFRTIPNPTKEEFKFYVKIVLTSTQIIWFQKIGKIRFMLTHFLRNRE
ncbi:MAG TPA: glycosyltransferase family 2 protein [Leptolyngbyaceae cyanobacterium]